VDATKYPFVLRERLGSQGALADVLASDRADVVTLVTDTFERRLGEECGKLRAEMSELRSDLRQDMKELRFELRSDFKVEVANIRADLLKWSFLFWVGQVAAVMAFISIGR
jgi:hypothetical protein